MNDESDSPKELKRMTLSRFLIAIFVLPAMFFLPAGTMAYWEAWVYLAILFIPMTFVLLYLLKNAPELLARRMRLRERQVEQKRIIVLLFVPVLLAYLLPGLDKRFGWSHVPAGVVIVADSVVLLGYSLFFLVFRANRYAARTIQVEPGQTVISSGPYAVVRHPMYVGALALYVFSPLALGSYWAMLPALLIIPVMVARIRHEESVLVRDLSGYRAYMQQVRYRLIPGVW